MRSTARCSISSFKSARTSRSAEIASKISGRRTFIRTRSPPTSSACIEQLCAVHDLRTAIDQEDARQQSGGKLPPPDPQTRAENAKVQVVGPSSAFCFNPRSRLQHLQCSASSALPPCPSDPSSGGYPDVGRSDGRGRLRFLGIGSVRLEAVNVTRPSGAVVRFPSNYSGHPHQIISHLCIR